MPLSIPHHPLGRLAPTRGGWDIHYKANKLVHLSSSHSTWVSLADCTEGLSPTRLVWQEVRQWIKPCCIQPATSAEGPHHGHLWRLVMVSLRLHADPGHLGGRDLRFYFQILTGNKAYGVWSQTAWFEPYSVSCSVMSDSV